MHSTETTWVQETLGHAQLGDRRRTARLVKIATAVARRPSGVLLHAMPTSAEREAAYRFVESKHIRVDAIAGAIFEAGALRAREHARVVVAVDQATLSITDRSNTKGLGRTGGRKSTSRRGLEVMSGIAIAPGREVLGLVGQAWHARSDAGSPPRKQDLRPIEARESGLWMRCIRGAIDMLQKHAPTTRAWFQLDRGADVNHVLQALHEQKADFTVRSVHARRLVSGPRLHDAARRSPLLGRVQTTIVDSHAPAGIARLRTAVLALRARPVSMPMHNVHGTRRGTLDLHIVHVREVTRSRRGRGLEWFLLTNVAASSLEAAHEVVEAYRHRWVIEEFHRAWKRGLCDVESSQLRSAAAFQRWATILAAVAQRAERLKTLSRRSPEQSALVELTRHELDAVFLLTKTYLKKQAPPPGAEISLGEAVEMIAFIGHYTGRKNSGGPPGATVIGRGLERVLVAAAILEAVATRSG